MRHFLVSFVNGFNAFVIVYFLLLNSFYLALVLIAARTTRRSTRMPIETALEDLFANPLTPGVSVLVPAYNEQKSIVDSVHAVLALRYPLMEVVIAEDGSTDDTFAALQEAFDLVPSNRVPAGTVKTVGAINSVHMSRDGRIVVVRKDNARRRGDALNVALEYARHPLVCMIDADSVLERDALLHVVRPFVDDPERVAASGGAIRPINGCPTDRGVILDAKAPKGWIPRIQVVEYLRSFLLGRTGWADANALLIISGAFGLFRRDLVVEVGGLDALSLAEDAELVVTLQEHLRRGRRPHRVVFVPEPVCWTEVPETLAVLGRQRRRWSHGLAQLLWKHRRMIGNPRFGPIGLLALPFFLLFELLGPVVELVGLAAVGLAAVLGALDTTTALVMFGLALGLGTLLSTAAVAVEEFSYARYTRGREVGVLLLAGLLENVGYRQLHAWFRLRGLVAALMRRTPVWTAMPRTGFTEAEPVAAS
jgi:cellulose synthase/poly-beta-1,6-N-acetylglucosamine synthase-like glycosyltransferase